MATSLSGCISQCCVTLSYAVGWCWIAVTQHHIRASNWEYYKLFLTKFKVWWKAFVVTQVHFLRLTFVMTLNTHLGFLCNRLRLFLMTKTFVCSRRMLELVVQLLAGATERRATIWQIGNEKVSLLLAPMTKMLKPSCVDAKKSQDPSPRSFVCQCCSGLHLAAVGRWLVAGRASGLGQRAVRGAELQRPHNAVMGSWGSSPVWAPDPYPVLK